MAEEPVSFGISDARRIDRAVGWYEHNIIDAREPRKQKQFPTGQTAAQGRLTSALTPCDNALTGATAFTFARYVTDGSIDPQTDPVTMMEEVDDADPPVIVETDGVNRSKLEAAVDGHVVCVKINGEWVAVLAFDVCSE